MGADGVEKNEPGGSCSESSGVFFGYPQLRIACPFVPAVGSGDEKMFSRWCSRKSKSSYVQQSMLIAQFLERHSTHTVIRKYNHEII